MMERQNVTLSLSKSLLKQAKALAAKEEKSLSAFMKESLEEKIRRTTGCMLIESAVKGGASVLLSEDFTDGQIIEGVSIKNPFLQPLL